MFKRKKKKTGIQTPEFRRPSLPPNPNLGWQPAKQSGTKPHSPPTSGSNAVKIPTYNPPPMPPVKPAIKNTMCGLKLYIPFDELNQYIHERVEDVYKDHTFIPVKVEVNELTLDIDISFLSVMPIECDKRYKLDLNQLPKEN